MIVEVGDVIVITAGFETNSKLHVNKRAKVHHVFSDGDFSIYDIEKDTPIGIVWLSKKDKIKIVERANPRNGLPDTKEEWF